ncbi:MAG: hypothetical protein WCA24_08220 [Thiomonas sp.]
MSKRAVLKALLAGGLTTLATAVLTVPAASSPHFPLRAVDVLRMTPLRHRVTPLIAVAPGQRIVVVNDTHRPLQISGFARRG